jgi:hypothetical protein
MSHSSRPPRTVAGLAGLLLTLCVLGCAPSLGRTQTIEAAKPFLGNWKWEISTPNSDSFENILKLAVADGAIVGTLVARGMESPVTDVRIEGDFIQFKVVRTRNNQRTFANYEGRLEGKVIRGKFESNFGGEKRTRDWEAMREADYAARPPNLNGSWRYSFPGHSGQVFEPLLRLKQDAKGITGTLQFNENSTPITEARLDGTNLWVKIVRERDGRSLTSIYKGGVSGNSIVGTLEVDWTGVPQTYKWEARRERRQ